ncbi:hypothetical protein BKA70DRAFT_1239693 [Coprinopsis sp. MPI-PUGE-AT-0042]|nr:hypothetical protein BKA70DRAFT_1239693 [Coprinopsis sp. MPI-PUGE-AT-0042]
MNLMQRTHSRMTGLAVLEVVYPTGLRPVILEFVVGSEYRDQAEKYFVSVGYSDMTQEEQMEVYPKDCQPHPRHSWHARKTHLHICCAYPSLTLRGQGYRNTLPWWTHARTEKTLEYMRGWGFHLIDSCTQFIQHTRTACNSAKPKVGDPPLKRAQNFARQEKGMERLLELISVAFPTVPIPKSKHVWRVASSVVRLPSTHLYHLLSEQHFPFECVMFSPFRRLPVELLTLIFDGACSDEKINLGVLNLTARLTVLQLQQPELEWAPKDARMWATRLKSLLQRSTSTFRFQLSSVDEVAKIKSLNHVLLVLASESHRWTNAVFGFPIEAGGNPSITATKLVELTFHGYIPFNIHAINLRSLNLVNVYHPCLHMSSSWRQITHLQIYYEYMVVDLDELYLLLEVTQMLQTFSCAVRLRNPGIFHPPGLTLRNLHHFRLVDYRGETSASGMFEWLNTPSLTSMEYVCLLPLAPWNGVEIELYVFQLETFLSTAPQLATATFCAFCHTDLALVGISETDITLYSIDKPPLFLNEDEAMLDDMYQWFRHLKRITAWSSKQWRSVSGHEFFPAMFNRMPLETGTCSFLVEQYCLDDDSFLGFLSQLIAFVDSGDGITGGCQRFAIAGF